MLDGDNPITLAFQRGQGNLIADWLVGISQKLRGFEGFDNETYLLSLVAQEVRKRSRPTATQQAADGKKPQPRRIDPNSMIPRPVAPKGPSGPVKVELPAGRPLGNSHAPWRSA